MITSYLSPLKEKINEKTSTIISVNEANKDIRFFLILNKTLSWYFNWQTTYHQRKMVVAKLPGFYRRLLAKIFENIKQFLQTR